jgi:hypothetical protein
VNIEIRGSGFSAKSSDFLPPKWSKNAGFWSDFGRISQQIRGFRIDYECGLYREAEFYTEDVKCKLMLAAKGT